MRAKPFSVAQFFGLIYALKILLYCQVFCMFTNPVSLLTSYRSQSHQPSGSSLQRRKVIPLPMLYFHLCELKFTYSFILDWVTMMQGLPSARRTSANGTSKLNPGNGLTAMTVLMMTKMFRSLMPNPLTVSNLSSWTFANNPVGCYATRVVQDCCLSPIQ